MRRLGLRLLVYGALMLLAALVGGQTASFTFNGSNDYYNNTSANNIDIGTGDVSLCAWIRCGASLTAQAAIADVDSNLSDDNVWLLVDGAQASCANDQALRTLIDDGPNVCDFCGTTDVCDDTWHHVCAVYDRGVDASLWIDGVADTEEVSTTCSTVTGDVNDGRVYLGALCGGTCPQLHFAGQLAHVQLFKTALTGEQIKQVMRCPWSNVPGVTKTLHYVLASAPSVTVPDQQQLYNLLAQQPADASGEGPPVSRCTE